LRRTTTERDFLKRPAAGLSQHWLNNEQKTFMKMQETIANNTETIKAAIPAAFGCGADPKH
jgi:hypothetical protein